MTSALHHHHHHHARAAGSHDSVPASRVRTGEVLLGTAVTGAVGYAIALWFGRMAVYAERVEEEQYCRPAAPAVAGLVPAQDRAASFDHPVDT